MALEKQFEDSYGNIYENGYVKIIKIIIYVKNETTSICLNYYKDKEARDANKAFVKNIVYDCNNDVIKNYNNYFSTEILDGDTNPVKQGYLYVKTLEEFKDARDV